MSNIESPGSNEESLDALTRDRRSCRAFLTDAVPRPMIDRMLTIAQRSPSWCNTQPWQVDITSGDGTESLRRALDAHIRSGAPNTSDFAMPAAYTGVHQQRRRVSGWQLYDAVGVQRGDRAASARQSALNYEFFGAPHVAVISTVSEQGVYGAVDGGLYAGNLLLAAQAVGIDTIAQAAVANHSAFIRQHLGIDDTRRILMAISFGFADQSHPANSFRTSRAAIDEAVRHHSD